MAYTESWDENYPDGASQQGFELDDEVRSAKTAIRERLEGDVALNGVLENFSTTAKPKAGMARVFYDVAANVGSQPLEDGRLFVSTDTNRLWHLAAGGYAELDYVSAGDAETITALWTFNRGDTPTQAIKIAGNEPAAEEQRNSHEIEIQATSKNASLEAKTAKWWIYLLATSTQGTGRLTFAYQGDGGARYNAIGINAPTGGDATIYSYHQNIHPNFNADMVDGKHASDLALASHVHSWSDLTSGEVGMNIIPNTNITYDLGENTTPKWFADAWLETVHTNDVYAATSTLYLRASDGAGWFINVTAGAFIPTKAGSNIGSVSQAVDTIYVDNLKDIVDLDTAAASDMVLKRNGTTRVTLSATGVVIGGNFTVNSGVALFSGGNVTVNAGSLTVSGGNIVLGSARALEAANTGQAEPVILCEASGSIPGAGTAGYIEVELDGTTQGFIKVWAAA